VAAATKLDDYLSDLIHRANKGDESAVDVVSIPTTGVAAR
jgi:hypothetical protein